MYGKACSLCSARFGSLLDDPWSLPKTITYVLYWKQTHGGLTDEALAAIPFVIYGYTGILPSGGSEGTEYCIPNSSPAKNYAFHWHWLPAKPLQNNPPPGGWHVKCN